MKEAEAKLMIESGVIGKATIYHNAESWEVWLYGDDLPSHLDNPVQLARGGRRTWASLDTAYSWIIQHAGQRKLQIDIDR